MVRLHTPAIVAFVLLMAVVALSLSQEGGSGSVVRVYTNDEIMEGEWNRGTLPPDRWIGLITTSQGWSRLPAESGYTDAQLRVQPDFDESIVIVAYMGLMPSGGHEIKFTRVEYNSAGETRVPGVTIRLHVTSPGPGELVTQALTHPFASIVIPKESWPAHALDEIGRGAVVVDVVDQDGRDWGPGHVL